jgi:hypothetical protein
MYPTITILDGSTLTTLCSGVGQRTSGQWNLEADITAPTAFAGGEPSRPVRAANATPPGRVMRENRVVFAVGQIFSDLATAYEARLTIAATCPVKGTLYINLSATRRINCANAQIENCDPQQKGLFVSVAFSFTVGAVIAENYS